MFLWPRQSDDTILVDEEREGVNRNGNDYPVDCGEARLEWPPVFIIHTCNVTKQCDETTEGKIILK